MNRSISVMLNAILALLGSGLALLMGLLAFLGVLTIMRQEQTNVPPDFPFDPVVFKLFMLLVPLVYILPAVWGICTGVGLLRLKNWARISIIVFAVLLVVFGVICALTSFALTMAPSNSPGLDSARIAPMRVVISVIAVVQLGLGIWWLVFFNLAKTRAQFQPQLVAFTTVPGTGILPPPLPGIPSQIAPLPGPAPAARRTRPLSISIIGWYLLITPAFLLLNLALRTPAILFTTMLTGWAAAFYYLAVGGVQVYSGIGLLRLQPAGRLVAMGYLLFGLLNSGVFLLAPGGHERLMKLMERQQSMLPWMTAMQQRAISGLDLTPFIIIGFAAGAVVVLVIFYFLFSARDAFAKAQAQPSM